MDERGRVRRDAVDRTAVGVEHDRARSREAGSGSRRLAPAPAGRQWVTALRRSPTWPQSSLAAASPRSRALGVARGQGGVETPRPPELRVQIAGFADRHARAVDCCQRREQPAEIAGGPEVLAAHVHRCDARLAFEMEDRRQLRTRVRSPALPGGERIGGLRPRPRHEEPSDGPRHRVHAKSEARTTPKLPPPPPLSAQ